MSDIEIIIEYGSIENYIYKLEQENKQLKEDIKELELLVGIRQKRNLIAKFNKEYDEEDKKNNPNRDYAGVVPDAEEVYKRYYELKEKLEDEVLCNEIARGHNKELRDKEFGQRKEKEKLQDQLEQRDEVIDKAIKRIRRGVFIIPKDTNEILEILQKYKGDSNE